jgi:hypothetical protein
MGRWAAEREAKWMRESKRASKEAKGEWKIHSYYAQHPTQRKENLKDFDIGRHVYAPESRRQRRFDSLESFCGQRECAAKSSLKLPNFYKRKCIARYYVAQTS